VERRQRVLVIEDDADSRALFEEILRESGIGVVCADHDALPEPDGFTLVVSDLPCSRQRYSSTLASDWVDLLRRRYGAPVIVVTGRSEAAEDAELLRTAHSVVSKPIDIDEFVTTVRGANVF
jgi:DNA-binding response OmpR family regulator